MSTPKSISHALKSSLRIGVVGAGVTGLLTSRLLARVGFQNVDVFDAGADPSTCSKPDPLRFSGVQIGPSAYHALRALDPALTLALERAGGVATHSGVRGIDGASISEALPQLARPSLFVSRSAFLHAIRTAPLTPLAAAGMDAGTSLVPPAVSYNHACFGMLRVTEAVDSAAAAGLDPTLSPAAAAEAVAAAAAAGEDPLPCSALQLHFFGPARAAERDPYHLVIGADGLYSSVRQQLLQTATAADATASTSAPRFPLRRGPRPTVLVQGFARADDVATALGTASDVASARSKSFFASLLSPPASAAGSRFAAARAAAATEDARTPRVPADPAVAAAAAGEDGDYRSRAGARADGRSSDHPSLSETAHLGLRFGYTFTAQGPDPGHCAGTAAGAEANIEGTSGSGVSGPAWVYWWCQVPEDIWRAAPRLAQLLPATGLSREHPLPRWDAAAAAALAADVLLPGLGAATPAAAIAAAIVRSSAPASGAPAAAATMTTTASAPASVGAGAPAGGVSASIANAPVAVVASATGELPFGPFSELTRWPGLLFGSAAGARSPPSPLTLFSCPPVVCVGHAAHSLYPDGGQDAAMVVEDALATALAAHLSTLLAERDWRREQDRGVWSAQQAAADAAADAEADCGGWSSGGEDTPAPAATAAATTAAAPAPRRGGNSGVLSPLRGAPRSPLPVAWSGAWVAARVRAVRGWRLEAELSRARVDAEALGEPNKWMSALGQMAGKFTPFPVRQAEYKKAYHTSVLEEFPELRAVSTLAKT